MGFTLDRQSDQRQKNGLEVFALRGRLRLTTLRLLAGVCYLRNVGPLVTVRIWSSQCCLEVVQRANVHAMQD